ncbi:hypothetical protein I7I48_07570 [Histoplasma ohiense]|nr:hypothetical protein I7I48_07570 [Histoplasma ohiense (nom. inval.)]
MRYTLKFSSRIFLSISSNVAIGTALEYIFIPYGPKNVSNDEAEIGAKGSYITEVLKILFVAGLLKNRPCFLWKLIWDVVLIELAILGAVHGFMAYFGLQTKLNIIHSCTR